MSPHLRVFILILLVTSCSATTHAGIIGATVGNDREALAWLEKVRGVTGLELLAKEDIDSGDFETDLSSSPDWDMDSSNRSGKWTLTDSLVDPTYWFVKFGQLVAIYEYEAPPSSSPWTNVFNLDADFFNPATDELFVDLEEVVDRGAPEGENVETVLNGDDEAMLADTTQLDGSGRNTVWKKTTAGTLNPAAGTSHVAVYGSPAGNTPSPGPSVVPEPASCAVWLGLAFVGVSRRRRR